jgi:hypothetical protein
MTPGIRRLYAPRRVEVEADSKGVPRSVEGIAVEVVREEWVVADRWWTSRPLRRHYFDLVLANGRDVVVFRGARGRWYRQQA